ncbi:sulfoxide reductase heme-binding subunit YedZ [Deinococcus metalli]|uniref:Protein-methionine-sulfoxide reductase heme-binding subunit MsrQ n=1 Tax=Deinococcus metalli TaxID=1141878 RepID=A0A7W8KB62_9DEIO|nr:protein-methionine-sulfoxide reductase heme-binding subunit MsrQ [Deinococcus metalli]MBB5375009.1 sulfoxide reductase heme-binding subunit YedZ [Deinococcus metalli]GHF32110.1 protein-methionine-sulfoxide reductase heme-binding subunit MsrQ [Deinococcus metalli]
MERPLSGTRPAPPRPRAAGRPLGWLVPAVTVGGLLPAVILIQDAVSGALGANPIQRATLQTGLLTLALLVLSLACTPLRLLTRWTWPARIRKSLGLLAFGYGVLHFLIYLFDHGFSLGVMVDDVVKRPFVTAGFTALLLMVPLALTSRKDSVKRLGFQRWTRLHQLVYVAVSLGVLHYYWGVKKDHTPPLIYAGIVIALFVVRWAAPRLRSGPRPARPAPGRPG